MNRAKPPRRGATLVDMLTSFPYATCACCTADNTSSILVGEVIAVLAVVAGENDFLSWHSDLFQKEVLKVVEVLEVLEDVEHLDHLDDLDHLI
jgi:hypothetical protein